MRKDWSLRRPNKAFLASGAPLLVAGVLTVAAPARSATILERTVSVRVDPGNRQVETTSLRVRLDSAADLDSWSAYSVPLDENRVLSSIEAFVLSGDGRRTRVERRHRDTVEYSGDSFYSSASFEVLTFTGLEIGCVVEIRHAVEIEAYYPAGMVLLRGKEPITELSVRISAAGRNLRWRILGESDDLSTNEAEGTLVVSGRGLDGSSAVSDAPAGADGSLLLFAWSDDTSWGGVAEWYREVLAIVPRDHDGLRKLARSIIEASQEPRERLEKVVAFVRREVRYVAVEVGIGGFRPTPAAEVMERKWGDCKDKSLLLLELLREVGIDAYPALVLSSERGRIEAEFPSPFQFNHMIVAVSAGGLALSEDAPVGDGFLFVDPTQTSGGTRWLHPGAQDQHALVVADRGGVLVRTPLRPQHEQQSLVTTMSVRPDGSAAGGAALVLRGAPASRFEQQVALAPLRQVEEAAQGALSDLLPGIALGPASWAREEGDIPALTITAPAKARSLIQGLGSGSPSLEIQGWRSVPDPSDLSDRKVPAVTSARSTSVVWNLSLPEGLCRPGEAEQIIENDVGIFVHKTRHGESPRSFTVERRLEIKRRWIEPEHLQGLKELALAEYRANKRRVRLGCG